MVNFNRIAMKVLEKNHPNEVSRFDELYEKEKKGTITSEELAELNVLDAMLLREFERLKLHYMVNWQFMSEEQKKEILEMIK